MKAKIYIGAKKYALYIGRKIVEKTLEFLSLPARFVSKKVQELKNLTMWGNSQQNGTPTPTTPIEVESVGNKVVNLFDKDNTTYGQGLYWNSSQELVATSSFYASNIIPVKGGKTYTRSFTNTSANYFKLADGRYLNIANKGLANTGVTVVAPDNAIEYFFNSDNRYLPENLVVVEGDSLNLLDKYQIPITVSGINLFDKTTAETGGYIQANGEWVTGSNTKRMYYIEIPQGITQISRYTFNWESSNANYLTRVGFYNESRENISVATNFGAHEKDTINIPTGAKYIQCSIGNKDVENSVIYWGNDTLTEYISYIQPTTTNIYLSEPLRKIGEYTDTLSVDGTNVTVIRNVGVLNTNELATEFLNAGTASGTYIGSQYVNIYDTDGIQQKFLNFNFGGLGSSGLGSFNGFCKKLVLLNKPISATNFKYGYTAIDRNLHLFIGDTRPSTRQEEAQRITDMNLELVLPLNIQTTETYTIDNPIELQQGTLTIDTDTIIKPSKIEITGDIDNDN